MKQGIGVVVVAMALVACSSETTGSGDQAGGGKGCADVSGNYEVTVTKLSGSCPEGNDPKTSITIGSDDQGLYVLLPGIEGGCPGTLDAASCRFQAQCKITQKGTDATLATYNLDYTFAGKTFKGSLVGAAAAGVIVPEACDSTVKHEGTRL